LNTALDFAVEVVVKTADDRHRQDALGRGPTRRASALAPATNYIAFYRVLDKARKP
jgi:hypothetical protein